LVKFLNNEGDDAVLPKKWKLKKDAPMPGEGGSIHQYMLRRLKDLVLTNMVYIL